MKKSFVLTLGGAALATSLLLTGCSTTGSVAPAAAPADSSKPAASAAPAPKPTNPKFGQAYAYKDGVTITVSAPAPYTPSQYAAGATQAHAVLFTLTIKNGSTKNLDPLPNVQVTSAGVSGSEIFDTSSDLTIAPPTATILPGNSITWKVAFSIADPAKLQLQVSPAMIGYEDAIFITQ